MIRLSSSVFPRWATEQSGSNRQKLLLVSWNQSVIFATMSKVVRILLLVLLSIVPVTAAEQHFAKPGPVQLTNDGRKWAAQTLKKMSLEEKVGQMFSVRYFMDFQNFDSDA